MLLLSDTKLHDRDTYDYLENFESARHFRIESESNLEASQVPSCKL